MADMNVLEYAERSADACTCTQRTKHVAAEVDALIEAATAVNKTLWEVGEDDDGRLSLIWRTYPIEAWEALEAEAARLQMIKSMLGMSK